MYSIIHRQQEEHPPIIANFGMGSILVNYYRKKSEKDEHIPKVSLGKVWRKFTDTSLGRPWRTIRIRTTR